MKSQGHNNETQWKWYSGLGRVKVQKGENSYTKQHGIIWASSRNTLPLVVRIVFVIRILNRSVLSWIGRSRMSRSNSATIWSFIVSLQNTLRIYPRSALPSHWVRIAVVIVDVFQVESMDMTREVSMSISRPFHTPQMSKHGCLQI
jgi:hypothetical protein